MKKDYFTNKYSHIKMYKHSDGYTLKIYLSDIGERLAYAQTVLDGKINDDMCHYIPNGDLMREVNTLNQTQLGTGILYIYPAEHDYAHYLYEGEKYVDPITGKGAFYSPEYGFWSRPNTTKVPSGEPLQFQKPDYTSHWAEVAFDNHGDSWYRVAQRALK